MYVSGPSGCDVGGFSGYDVGGSNGCYVGGYSLAWDLLDGVTVMCKYNVHLVL